MKMEQTVNLSMQSNIFCMLLLLIIMFYYQYLAKQEQFPLKVVVIIKLPDGGR
jgi:hypothetical protein